MFVLQHKGVSLSIILFVHIIVMYIVKLDGPKGLRNKITCIQVR